MPVSDEPTRFDASPAHPIVALFDDTIGLGHDTIVIVLEPHDLLGRYAFRPLGSEYLGFPAICVCSMRLGVTSRLPDLSFAPQSYSSCYSPAQRQDHHAVGREYRAVRLIA